MKARMTTLKKSSMKVTKWKPFLILLIGYFLMPRFLAYQLDNYIWSILIGELLIIFAIASFLYGIVKKEGFVILNEGSSLREEFSQGTALKVEKGLRIFFGVILILFVYSLTSSSIPDAYNYFVSSEVEFVDAKIESIRSLSSISQSSKRVSLSENEEGIQYLNSLYLDTDFNPDSTYRIEYLPRTKYVLRISELDAN